MAKAAREGAAGEEQVLTTLQAASATVPDDVLAADGFLFIGPEALAALSGEMKDVFDRCYYPALGRVEGRPYAHLVCAGSDGSNAARQLARIVTGWRLKPIQDPLIIRTGAQEAADILAPKTIPEADLKRCRDLGAAMAAGLALGIF